MFRLKFEDINMNSQPIKASVAKGMKQKIVEIYPNIEQHIDIIWPKNAKVLKMKFKGDNNVSFVKIDDLISFIEIRDKEIMPMLRLLHMYPEMMSHMVCDKGAIRHIFSGSNVMAPGLTSEGGIIAEGLEIGAPVAVMAEGKTHAMAIGYLAMSSKDIKEEGKGMAIEIIQFLNDSLWTD